MDFSAIFTFFAKFLPYLYALLGFCVLIVVHEFGHFIFCKLFGIHTPTFSIGFGPKLIETKIGDTNFRISALPLGGYVEIAGNAEIGQGEQHHAKSRDRHSFATKPYWQKLLVLCGGILFNILLAYLLMIGILYVGSPKSHIYIKQLAPDSVCEQADLRAGDRIVRWNDSDISQKPELLSEEIGKLAKGEAATVTICIERHNREHTATITLPATEESSKEPRLGILGFDAQPSETIERLSLKDAIVEGVRRTNSFIAQTCASIYNLIRNGSLKGAGGPILILAESSKQAQQSFAWLLKFLAIISINLAVLNLLPFPIFDGGQILTTSIEALIRREIPMKLKYAIHLASWLLMLLLLLVFSFNDIKNLLRR